MTYLWLLFLAWFGNSPVLNRISQSNLARKEGQAAYRAGQYAHAIRAYSYLVDMSAADAATRLNLAHAYYQLDQLHKARLQYEVVSQSGSQNLVEQASVQLGVIACRQRDSAAALMHFRQALLHNPDNEAARYNFELLKLTYSGPKSTASRSAQVARPQTQQTSAQEVAQSTRQQDILNRYRRADLNDEQALQLLDALQADDLSLAAAALNRPKPKSTGESAGLW
jgi:hypothetical protein